MPRVLQKSVYKFKSNPIQSSPPLLPSPPPPLLLLMLSSSLHHHNSRSLDNRYPDPDPNDPFAPLWVLRTRSSNPAIDLRGLYHPAAPPPLPSHTLSTNPRRRSQSTPVDVILFPTIPGVNHLSLPPPPPPPSEMTDHTGESGSTTDVDTIIPPIPSKRPFRVPRFFLSRFASKSPSSSPSPSPRLPKKSISPPQISAPLPEVVPLRRAATCEGPTPIKNPSSPNLDIKPPKPILVARIPPATLKKKPAPPIPSPLISSPVTSPSTTPPTTFPAPTTTTPTTLSCRPHSLPAPNPTQPSLSLSLAPHPTLYPPPDPEWHLPTPAQLAHAASLPLTAPSGLRVPFAALFASQRTVVVFLRHVWCPLCQDYMSTLTSAAQPNRMFAPLDAKQGENKAGVGETQPVNLVVITNGAPAFIPKYKQLFGLTFEMYADPELRVYRALGMGRTASPGEGLRLPAEKVYGHAHDAPLLDGGYVRHSLVGGIAMVAMRALRSGMPVWEKGGDFHQLGGEFVLGPGLQCGYAHRMQTPKGHAPIVDVLKAAGVVAPTPSPPTVSLPPVRTTALMKRSNSTGTHTSTTNMREFGAVPNAGLGRGGARTSRTAAGKLEGRANVHPPHAHMRTRIPMSVSIPPRTRDSVASLAQMTAEEEARWMEGRAEALERLRARKSARRGAFVGELGTEGEEGQGELENENKEKEKGPEETEKSEGQGGALCGSQSVSMGRIWGRVRAGQCSPVWEEEGEMVVIGFLDDTEGRKDD